MKIVAFVCTLLVAGASAFSKCYSTLPQAGWEHSPECVIAGRASNRTCHSFHLSSCHQRTCDMCTGLAQREREETIAQWLEEVQAHLCISMRTTEALTLSKL